MHIRHKKHNMIETLPRNLLSVAFWTNLIFYLHISDVFSAVFRQIFRTTSKPNPRKKEVKKEPGKYGSILILASGK